VGVGEGGKTKEGQKPINTLAERTTNNGPPENMRNKFHQ